MKKLLINFLSKRLRKSRNIDLLYGDYREQLKYIDDRFYSFSFKLLFKLDRTCQLLNEERQIMALFILENVKDNSGLNLNLILTRQFVNWFFERKMFKEFGCNILSTGFYTVSLFERMCNYYLEKSRTDTWYRLDFSNEDLSMHDLKQNGARIDLEKTKVRQTNILIESLVSNRFYSVEGISEIDDLWNLFSEKEIDLVFKECEKEKCKISPKTAVSFFNLLKKKNQVGVNGAGSIVSILVRNLCKKESSYNKDCTEGEILYVLREYIGREGFGEKIYLTIKNVPFKNEEVKSLVSKIKLGVELKKELIASKYIEDYKAKKKINKV